jgi:hypothetical protein
MFYVYENWTHDRGRIHKGECSHCNHGQGKHGTSSERNGRWLPPFDTREEALAKAMALGRADMRPCAVCNP